MQIKDRLDAEQSAAATTSPLGDAANGSARPLMLAVGGGVVAAIAAYMTPIGPVESMVNAIGLSEIIPAFAPPLGTKAKILLSLGTGLFAIAFIFAVTGLSTRRALRFDMDGPPVAPTTPGVFEMAIAAQKERLEDGKPSFFDRMKATVSRLPMPRRFADADEAAQGTPTTIRDFKDLPRLRTGDSAAADEGVRAPLSAHRDLGEPLLPVSGPAPAPASVEGDDAADRPKKRQALPPRDQEGNFLDEDSGAVLAPGAKGKTPFGGASMSLVEKMAAALRPNPVDDSQYGVAPDVEPTRQFALPDSAYMPGHAPKAASTPVAQPTDAPESAPASVVVDASPARPAMIAVPEGSLTALVDRLSRALDDKWSAESAAPVDDLPSLGDALAAAEAEAQRLQQARQAHLTDAPVDDVCELAQREAELRAVAEAEEAARLEAERAEAARIEEERQQAAARAAEAEEAARLAAEAAAQAAEDAAAKAAEARALAEQLSQGGVAPVPPREAPALREVTRDAVEPATTAPAPDAAPDAAPEVMDEALRSALRTLRRMSAQN